MKLLITQRRSLAGRPQGHRATIAALGLKRIGHQVVHNDTPQIRGMVAQVTHLVQVEEVAD
jgi:large subunit ribosomal protein L30